MSVRLLLTLFCNKRHYRLTCISEAPVVWRLEKLNGLKIEATYDVVDVSGHWSCDCPSAIMRPERGECKHVAALKEARIIR